MNLGKDINEAQTWFGWFHKFRWMRGVKVPKSSSEDCKVKRVKKKDRLFLLARQTVLA